MTQDIGTRMKSYESNRRLTNGAVIVRIDGKAFHTWTKQVGASKPFDGLIVSTMIEAVRVASEQMQGFRLAYTQSDEASFLLVNEGDQQPWFGNKLDKLISISSSMFTYHFNNMWGPRAVDFGKLCMPAYFDSRAFNIPIEDAGNYFYWRQLDWKRNSVIMLARSFFSHKELLNKSVSEIKEMLLHRGVDWNKQLPWHKHGTFWNSNKKANYEFLNYHQVNELAGINVT